MTNGRSDTGPIAFAIAAGVGFSAVVAVSATAAPWWATASVLFGIVWMLLPLAIVAGGERGSRRKNDASDTHEVDPAGRTSSTNLDGAVVAMIRVTDEPSAVAETTILLAATTGPTVVLSSNADGLDLNHPDIEIVTAPTLPAALAQAVALDGPPWMLLCSARAIPDGARCRQAIEHADGEVDWIVGRSRMVGAAHPEKGRAAVGERLRQLARRSGLWLWEPDAVLVRREVLKRHPIGPGEPMGAWLRQRAADTYQGQTSDLVLSVRSEPRTGAAGWSFAVSRQRALAAELREAMLRGAPAHRLSALAVLARELCVLSLVALSVPWWATIASGTFPMAIGPLTYLTWSALLAVSRYAALRRVVRVPARLVADGWNVVGSIPAGLASVAAAMWWRPRRRTSTVQRPLIWSALVLTLFTGAGLVGQVSSGQVPTVSVAFSGITLFVLWLVGLRSMIDRSWERSTLRVGLDLPAHVGCHEAVVADGSLHGLAVRLSHQAPRPVVGDRAVIDVITTDGGLRLEGRVVVVRSAHGTTSVGVSLEHDGETPRAWLEVLADGLAAAPPSHGHGRSGQFATAPMESVRRSWHDRALGVAAAMVSVVVLSGLAMVFSGIQPHVIRSGSMVPTYGVGDVVLNRAVLPAEVRVGDVITRPSSPEWTETLTHRVVAVSSEDGGYSFRTQGDANDFRERWSVPGDRWLGRTVGSIPSVGLVAVAVRSNAGAVLLLAAATFLAFAAIRRPKRADRPHPEVNDCQISTQRRHAGRSSGA